VALCQRGLPPLASCVRAFLLEGAGYMPSNNDKIPSTVSRVHRKIHRIADKIEADSGGKKAICKKCGNLFEQIWIEEYNDYTDFDMCKECRTRNYKGTQKAVIPYEPHWGQKLVHESKARFKLLNCGTRWGKDRCMTNEYIMRFVEMLNEDRGPDLVPAVYGWIIAPTYTMARQNWRELLTFFPRQWITNYWVSDRMISTVNDGIIEVRSADDPEALVGVGLDIVLITEAARIKYFDQVWINIENRLMSPGRGPKGKGGIGLINSSPRGRNFFYTMYKWGQKDDPDYDPEWESWRFTSYDNPYIDRNWLERAKKRYPERIFRQEIMAEFLAEGNSVFPTAKDCATYTGSDEPEPGEEYIIGYDPAKSIDNSGVVVRNSKGQAVRVEQWKGKDWTYQFDTIAYLSQKYNNARVILDKTGLGETIPEQLTLRGLEVEAIFFSNQIKEQLVNNLAMLIEQKIIVYPNYEPLINELLDYEYSITESGLIRYHSSTARKHDDLVTAMMLAFKNFIISEVTIPWIVKVGNVKRSDVVA